MIGCQLTEHQNNFERNTIEEFGFHSFWQIWRILGYVTLPWKERRGNTNLSLSRAWRGGGGDLFRSIRIIGGALIQALGNSVVTVLIKRLPLLLGLLPVTSPAPRIPQIILQKDNISPFTIDDTVIHSLFMILIRLLSLAHCSPHAPLSKDKLIHSTLLAITNMQMTPNFSSLVPAFRWTFHLQIPQESQSQYIQTRTLSSF